MINAKVGEGEPNIDQVVTYCLHESIYRIGRQQPSSNARLTVSVYVLKPPRRQDDDVIDFRGHSARNTSYVAAAIHG